MKSKTGSCGNHGRMVCLERKNLCTAARYFLLVPTHLPSFLFSSSLLIYLGTHTHTHTHTKTYARRVHPPHLQSVKAKQLKARYPLCLHLFTITTFILQHTQQQHPYYILYNLRAHNSNLINGLLSIIRTCRGAAA